QAAHVATTMFELLGCQDMARVDFRVDRSGKPWFLEINPLPSFDPEGTVGLLAEYMNLTYSQLIGRILDAALSRIQSRGVPHGNTQ
ncbi:MAG: D-alanine--D-alanine ligase, partial [Candidatus Omnitrophica bacterium]|nr:D-alanine--D-alanine ligase [Candidatus Omnitrophota bacterium]